MESSFRSELECLICLDLIIEPVTTVCGHTFCKFCLIRNLKTKLNCPMCRDPILQNGENMKKNVIMENLIKAKFPKEYEEKLKAKKSIYESELINSDPNEHMRFMFPSIIALNQFIWPGQKINIKLINSIFTTTVRTSSVNDRNLVLIPYEDHMNKVCCLCEIQNLNYNDDENSLTFDLIGKLRFKPVNFQSVNLDGNNLNSPLLYVSAGEIVKDKEIFDDEIKNQVLTKLKDIDFIHGEILANAGYSILINLKNKFGEMPKLNLNTIANNSTEANRKLFETLSFYYLNIIKSQEKDSYYITDDLFTRLNWIYEKFINVTNHMDNQSLPIHFYDLSISGQPKDHLQYMIFLILAAIVLGISLKLKWIQLE